uniref:Cytokine-like nuclear factor N-PAC n=1 Tax=Phallusia mammillata TaxID=59560 RepID=A0A6F9DDX8_9ASCI|nr:glyoxylate/succinic semialdehyde reductase 1 [Phallusia mammillata]
MANFQVGDFVWAKMTGYPYWPGKVAEPDKDVKKPSKKVEMFFIRFYGTGDYAWTKADLVHDYAEQKQKYAIGKAKGFLEAVRQIDHAVERRAKGLPDTSDEESEEESEGSDDQPLAKKAKHEKSSSATASGTPPKKRRKSAKKSLPTREELTLKHQNMSHYLLTQRQNAIPPSANPVHVSSVDNLNLTEPCVSPDTTADADSTTSIVAKDVIPTDKKIGFLGLGIMGIPMAMNLIKSGHDVTVWNRNQNKCKQLLSAGAKEGTSPADVVQQCDITFSCVSDSTAVRDLVIGNSGVLQGITSGKGYVEMSTVDNDTIKEISEAISMRGGRFLEAPVSGSKKAAETGQLVILAAGDRSLYMDGYSCFEAMGKKTFFLGELGCGANTKLIVNMLTGTFMASLAEGLSLAEKAGLDQYTLLDVLNLSAISCPLVQTKGSAILEGHFPANFPLKHQQKDLRLALQMGEVLEQPLHVAGAANELYKRTKAIGFGDRDMSCVYRAVNA